ncbi:hypothetical protein ACU045_10520 [Microbacterium sp. MAHUQ-60]|uniref:hypothetical protein n=1 Tax=unclassified Microbacterium TaxID=2609290 RepID=UPI00361BCCA1
MRAQRTTPLAVGIAVLLVLTGCASDGPQSASDATGAATNTTHETPQEPRTDSAADVDSTEITIPAGAYAASAEFPFPIPEGWAVLDEFVEGKLGKDITVDGSVEYPGEAKDAAATYLTLLKDAGFDAYTYSPGELTNQASLAADGFINGTRYLTILNDVHADGKQRVSVTAAEKD